jgi:hypothetical protein
MTQLLRVEVWQQDDGVVLDDMVYETGWSRTRSGAFGRIATAMKELERIEYEAEKRR